MNKHTPGPWHYFETADGICRVKPLNRKYIVAECSAMEPQCEEQRSNARLIAAAPELLEALKDTLQLLEVYCGDFEEATRNQACAAIAKAEGGQT